MAATMKNVLIYEGCNFFRQRLILATLSGKSVKIKKIRDKEDDPGIKDFEASFIRLIDKITNGSTIEVNETGTAVYYQPGMLTGGSIQHDCNIQRAIGYYLEALLCLAAFTKKPISATLRGITSDQLDPSVDLIKFTTLPVLKRFLGTDEGLQIKVLKRGAAPDGGGEILFTCPCRQKLRPVQFTDPGKIKRIRGVAWAVRVSPAVCNRVVESARSILNKFLPDIYIYTDHHKGSQSGRSPGFGLVLVAETINGTFLGAEVAANPRGSKNGPTVPEDLGIQAANVLMEEVYRGGSVDSSSQGLAVLLMALGDKDVSKIRTGPLSPYTVQFLRHLRDFLQVMFKLDVLQATEEGGGEEGSRLGGDKVELTCVGAGFRNLSKPIL
ncbi:hypothetical protein NP493_500g00016 [Ridgeia piscesae]|uniref:RNA 3'-terminal phosphate cyclase-like protein n=1 Tax=Ridgeia piscesae TaxID=27915 RepID=A0AAD9KXK6_RIDPI|nr:hypothetical protein NP493_500g00016 [Ridgeia piscesae]